MSIVKVENLIKRYKELTAIDNLSLEINEGEIFGLLGPNGSGKTTLINCILSLLKYEKGKIEIFDKPMGPSAYDIKKDIGLVMQNLALYEELTVYENIDYFCSLYVNNKSKRKQLVEEAISFVGLDDFKKFTPKKLSGGLKRRLNIACGIVHKPKLIILDEPTVAVDPQSRNNILEGIKKLNENGATIIYTSHYMEEVEEICTRISIMDKGKIVAMGTKEDLKAMVSVGEKIVIESYNISVDDIKNIKNLLDARDAEYKNNILTVKCNASKSNLPSLLKFVDENNLNYNKLYTELPTLNDVFLEITGKKLRD